MTIFGCFRTTAILVFLLAIVASAPNVDAQNSEPQEDVPPELQPADPQVKAYVDSAEKAGQEGKYPEAFQQLQAGLDLCVRKSLVADKALIQAKLGAAYFVEGRLTEAKQQWLSALSDSITTGNLVLQADTLVALSGMAQAEGNVTEAVEVATRALDLARKSKNLLIQSRCLGELGHLQLTAGKSEEARALVEEALRIDKLNKYRWEASHLLYLAWITYGASKLDEAIQLANSARDLAVKQENYIVFMQASESLGQAYVAKGDLTHAIALLEHSRDGVSDSGGALFQHPGSYRAAMALPYPKIVFLEAIALAYQSGQRTDDALRSWQELYDTARTANFVLAAAEAAHRMASIYQARKEAVKAIDWYALAAEAWAKGGNAGRRIDAIASEAFLLHQQDEADKAIHLYQELLPLLDAAGNHSRQFLIALSIAEIAQPRGDLDRAGAALHQAESLLSADLTLPGVETKFILELYWLEATIYQAKKEFLPLMIALEKAIPSADTAATAEQIAILDREMSATLESMHARETAAEADKSGDLAKALQLYELIQHFEETHARWSGKGEDYNRKNVDPFVSKVSEIPFRLVAQPAGAAALENNLQNMGPIAQMARLPILIALSHNYMQAGQPAMVVKFATLALPQLRVGETDQPNRWEVEVICELAYSLLLQKDMASAVQRAGTCLRSAQKLGDPQLLSAAHKIRAFVLQAAGRASEAQDSVRFLAQNPPDDPQYDVQLAQFQSQQGMADAAVETWKTALRLFGARKDLKGSAFAHMGLATALSAAKKGSNSNDDVRSHLEAALSIFRDVGDLGGQAKASVLLGEYFTEKADSARALEHFDTAVNLSREANEPGIQAWALSLRGNAYRKASEPAKALDSYRKAAELYRSLKDTAHEASELQNQAEVLDELHKTEETLQTYLKAKRLADSSDSWLQRYWVRRLVAIFYETHGEYENALGDLREARAIADNAHQLLDSARASLALAQTLATVGEGEEAIEALNLALPVFRESKDVENESAVYLKFTDIYGRRESEFKDFGKALEYYRSALQVAAKNDPARAVSLNLDAVEIYWQQGRFKEAASLANESLDYYRNKKDDWGQANSLLSLAEIQRSVGDIQAAATAMRQAESFMKRIDDFYMTGRFRYGLANQKKIERHYQEAIYEYERVIAMLEQFKSTAADASLRRKVSNTYGYIYDELIDTYFRLGEQQPSSKLAQADHALQQAELNKSRSFTTSWGRAFVEALRRKIPGPLQDRERALSARQNELQSELARIQSGRGERGVKQVQEDLKVVARELDAFAKEMRTVSPAYAEVRFPEIAGLATLPLRPGEIFVEFKMLEDSLLVWMIEGTDSGPQLISFYKVERPGIWFEERILALRSAFNRAAPDLFDPQIAEDLFNALFPATLAGHLTSAKAVIFVPDDILFLLPFELLSPQASHSQFVLLQMPTSYFPSAAALRLSRTLAPTKHDWLAQFFGMADPITSADDERYAAASVLTEVATAKPQAVANATQSAVRGPLANDVKARDYFFTRLPDTATEVQNIAALFPSGSSRTMVLTGIDARKRELFETDLSRFRFVHFATHGFFPVESGIREPALVLSYDGKDQERMMLTLSEVVQLKLHADMVVLSACNTGSGKVTRAEGVSSLGTAFLAAGASSATTSLWKVSDKSTALFMQEFYRGLLKGMPKGAA